MRTLADWLAHLESLHPKGQAGIELGLERVARVKAQLGQRESCPVIIVGGTNGKGSTCAYLDHILSYSGYRTGCYASPHLLAYNERVRLDREPVADAPLCDAFARVEAARVAAGDVALTYFEFGTLAAWEVFAAANVDVAILEVGLGGRLDAVNVYEPDVSVVTGIALDHTDWLGPDRESIGREKAGIFRAGRPAICADPQPPQSLVDHATAIGADLQLIGRDFGYFGDKTQWTWWGRNNLRRGGLANPGIRGSQQLANASAALAALDAVKAKLPVDMQSVRRGLIEIELAGRFQLVPGKPAVVLDVAHNPQAVGVLAANLGDMGFYAKTHAVVGMLADKDVGGALAALAGKVDHWHLATLAVPRGATAETLAQAIAGQNLGGSVDLHADPAAAFAAARKAAGEDDRILAFGSFYTVAAVMRALKERP
ncbi:bifunctional tetrahydrofolate synthase/dihydrofolate synthase [Azospira restricta]|uniref:Dihydrofolate synthase/folylpolyglutamate synthase n=1 Tax=Azospira restricta TaxID=404405 RepID=A0A974PXN0_9RHOO|nr:bifunctional tetrahydrofolate synthase/dihydrofolate synthase [Azospira restricta]QRJ63374.1 bifunctional tetrahydrofolate synthase/dihydrofolate synthase [Azospira restricta]